MMLMMMTTVEPSFSGLGELGESWPFMQKHFSNIKSLPLTKSVLVQSQFFLAKKCSTFLFVTFHKTKFTSCWTFLVSGFQVQSKEADKQN